MSDNSSKTSPSLSVDEFIALNDEIASLLKAGVPLDVGLSGYATSVSGRLSKVSSQVAEGVSRGESLENAFESTQTPMPVAYRAILEAGAASGRLPEALESLSDHARRLRETRRQLRLALIYPVIVIVLAWCLFWFFVAIVTPHILDLSLWPGEGKSAWAVSAEKISSVMNIAGPVPLLLFLGFLVWELLPVSSSSRQARLDFRGIRWIPGGRKARRAWNLSAFTEIAANLLQHNVPAPRALQMAAKTTADRALIADVQSVAEALQNGETAAPRIDSARSFPSFMKWMWKAGEQQSAVIPTFQQLADHYQLQAEHRITRIQIVFPMLVTVFIAGGVVALYALAIFTPFTDLLLELSQEAI